MKVERLVRYPVKGLGPEYLECVDVDTGGSIPQSRADWCCSPGTRSSAFRFKGSDIGIPQNDVSGLTAHIWGESVRRFRQTTAFKQIIRAGDSRRRSEKLMILRRTPGEPAP